MQRWRMFSKHERYDTLNHSYWDICFRRFLFLKSSYNRLYWTWPDPLGSRKHSLLTHCCVCGCIRDIDEGESETSSSNSSATTALTFDSPAVIQRRRTAAFSRAPQQHGPTSILDRTDTNSWISADRTISLCSQWDFIFTLSGESSGRENLCCRMRRRVIGSV